MAQRMLSSSQRMVSSSQRVISALEKAKLVCWFEETNSLAKVARRYRSEFGMEPPQLDQVRKWHQRFLQTGSVISGGVTPHLAEHAVSMRAAM